MTALNKQALREELEICSKDRMRRMALALLDELEAKDVALSSKDYHFDQDADRIKSLEKALEDAEKRIAEQNKTLMAARSYVKSHAAGDGHAFGVLQAIDRAAGLGVKGE